MFEVPETGRVYEWRIMNLSHWCAGVHGIDSPGCYQGYFSHMILYPKGTSLQEEHLVVRFCDIQFPFSGELSFCSSDGSLLGSKQSVNVDGNKSCMKLPPGPKFNDVLSKIRESEDFITVTLLIKYPGYHKRCFCTSISVLKISLEINPKWIEEMKPNETKYLFNVQLISDDNLERVWLKICSEDNAVHFVITPPTKNKETFAVEMCMSLTRNDETVGSCVKKEHVFCDGSSWTFPDPLERKELDGKRISLFFCLKTEYFNASPFYMSCANSCVSIESKSKICFPETDSMTVLTKDLMCLYQDQKFSDITLKSDNFSFPVHRNILSTRSPVLDRLLCTGMKEAASGSVDIEDLDPSTLSRFLTYLYTGAVEADLQHENALKLYYAADKYQVPSLKKECCKLLGDNLLTSNVCDILSFANKHQDLDLTTVSHNFILNNFNEVLRSNEWDTFKGREPLLAVNTVTSIARNIYWGK